MADPWRKVIYIGHVTGSKGGLQWSLLLECGHRAYRSFPRLGPEAAINHSPVSLWNRLSAPKKARCLSCGVGSKTLHPRLIEFQRAYMEKHEPIT